jgi:hypothetical protein
MIKDNEVVPTTLQIKPWDKKVMYSCFQFENGPIRHLKSAFLQLYILAQSSVADVQVITCATINRTLKSLFIHKKPAKEESS